MLALFYIVFVISGFAQNIGLGLTVLILGPIVFVVYLAIVRMTLEFYLAIVRMSQDIHKRLPGA